MARAGPNTAKRLDVRQSRKLLSWILRCGQLSFSQHARDAMKDDDLTEPDVVNILRCGMVSDQVDFERGSWRYRVETERMCATVVFLSGSEVVVVTVWRKGGRRNERKPVSRMREGEA